MGAPSPNPLLELRRLGQSVWLDDIGRALLDDGTLVRLIEEDGLAGVTSNPAIFAHAIMKEPQYVAAIANVLDRLSATESSSTALYETLAIDDLRRAADLFRKAFDRTTGADGFVSLEVSPHLADDTAGTVAEGRRLWQRLERPNALIKVPGTQAGLGAIRDLTADGINVNVTLLFSPEQYRAVAQAYMAGLETRVTKGQPIRHIASVASFFLSRIDTLVDKLLDDLAARGQPAARALRGKAAIASACRAYEIYEETVALPRWQALIEKEAKPQRLLWASTSTKDPTYSPIKYVEELVVPNTVNTMPLETLQAYRRFGRPELRLERHIAEGSDAREALERLGIDLEVVAGRLEREGVRKFIEPFDALQAWLGARRTRSG